MKAKFTKLVAGLVSLGFLASIIVSLLDVYWDTGILGWLSILTILFFVISLAVVHHVEKTSDSLLRAEVAWQEKYQIEGLASLGFLASIVVFLLNFGFVSIRGYWYTGTFGELGKRAPLFFVIALAVLRHVDKARDKLRRTEEAKQAHKDQINEQIEGDRVKRAVAKAVTRNQRGAAKMAERKPLSKPVEWMLDPGTTDELAMPASWHRIVVPLRVRKARSLVEGRLRSAVESCWANGDLDGATAILSERLKFKPSDCVARECLAETLERAGDAEGAISEYKRLLDFEWKRPRVHERLGTLLRSKGRLGEAVKEFRKATQSLPDDKVLRETAIDAINQLRRKDGSFVEFLEAFHSAPGLVLRRISLAIRLWLRGDSENAKAEFLDAIRIQVSAADGYERLGDELFRIDDMTAARHAYEAAERQQPEQKRAINKKIAIGFYYDALREMSWNPALGHRKLGDACKLREDLDGAIAEYSQVLSIDPSDSFAHLSLGEISELRDDLEGAITHYREVVRLEPDWEHAHVLLAEVLGKTGDRDGAIAEYREAIRLDAKDAFAHHDLGRLLERKGVLDEALGAYHSAWVLKPEIAPFRNDYERVVQKLRH